MPKPRRQPAQPKSAASRPRIARSTPRPAAHPPAPATPPSPDEAASAPTSEANDTGKRQRRASPPPDFLSVEEFAKRLGVSSRTIRRLIGSKDPAHRIRAVRVGGQVRIPIGEYYRYASSLPAVRP